MVLNQYHTYQAQLEEYYAAGGADACLRLDGMRGSKLGNQRAKQLRALEADLRRMETKLKLGERWGIDDEEYQLRMAERAQHHVRKLQLALLQDVADYQQCQASKRLHTGYEQRGQRTRLSMAATAALNSARSHAAQLREWLEAWEQLGWLGLSEQHKQLLQGWQAFDSAQMCRDGACPWSLRVFKRNTAALGAKREAEHLCQKLARLEEEVPILQREARDALSFFETHCARFDDALHKCVAALGALDVSATFADVVSHSAMPLPPCISSKRALHPYMQGAQLFLAAQLTRFQALHASAQRAWSPILNWRATSSVAGSSDADSVSDAGSALGELDVDAFDVLADAC